MNALFISRAAVLGESDAAGELNDCAVVATALAFNRPYKEVHEVFARFGRKPRRGANWRTVAAVLEHFGVDPSRARVENWSRLGAGPANRYPTVAAFTALHAAPEAAYLVYTSGHMLCVKGRISLDNANKPRRRAILALRIS